MNLFVVLFFSLIISLIISYNFNTILYKKIKNEENIFNALLNLVKINFSLLKTTYHTNSDFALTFIQLINKYNLDNTYKFKELLLKIHEGQKPESLLLGITTPSVDFNRYVIDLLVNNFNIDHDYSHLDDTSSEKSFKVILRDIETKISVIFFIGLFFPIGLCFLILFQRINFIVMVISLPLFLLLLKFLFQRLVKIDIFLIGVLKEYSNKEKKSYDEFLVLLKNFAFNLKTSVSPEVAFMNTIFNNKNLLKYLRHPIKNHLSQVLNFNYSFDKMLDYLKSELKGLRYVLVLDTIQRMLKDNALFSSNRILNILDIISRHRKLEEKLEIIIKGEKFKVFLFLILLPMITGAIGGMFPLVLFLTNNQDFNINNYLSQRNFDIVKIFIIFLTLLLSNLISSFYFLKIIQFEKKYLLILFSIQIYIFTFFLTLMNLSYIL
jgi:hypothetical protein